jgi:two-component system cell cycle sensor histidine kinase/response regulator CckA
MSTRLSVLVVEDDPNDALLLERELRRGTYDKTFQQVDSRASMEAALARQPWDVIVADYVLPAFGAVEALALVQQHGLDIPFIIVSGVVDDDAAVAALKAGAHDFMTKS